MDSSTHRQCASGAGGDEDRVDRDRRDNSHLLGFLRGLWAPDQWVCCGASDNSLAARVACESEVAGVCAITAALLVSFLFNAVLVGVFFFVKPTILVIALVVCLTGALFANEGCPTARGD